jgi:putative chitinase
MLLKFERLTGQIPDVVLAQIPACAEKFQINTPLRLAHFLAQCAHESANFKATEENLNYSVEGLKKTFGKYFTDNLALTYAHKPEKIANWVYANRMGNGNETSGDGYRFRGRGYIQLTGKSNYEAFAAVVAEDVVSHPELVASRYALLSAAWFWNLRSLNGSADKGAMDSVVAEVTKKVNGGTLGLSERIGYFKRYYPLLVA